MKNGNRVWSKFSRKTIEGDIKRFRIEQVSTDRIEGVIQLSMKYFIREEAIQKAVGISQNAEAVAECREIITKTLYSKPHHIVICCLDDEEAVATDFIGASVMCLVRKGDINENYEMRTPEMVNSFKIAEYLNNLYSPISEYQLDCFYEDKGVMVHPIYRGLGIAKEFFKVRRMVCEEQGVPLTGAWMTSAGSQKAAKRDGWETVYEVDFGDIGRQFELTFQDVPSKCRFMVAKIK